MKIASLTPKQWASGQLVQIKPKLRGWLHLAAAPLSLAASIVLVCLAPTTRPKSGRPSICMLPHSLRRLRDLPPLLLAPRWEIMWKRLDHSNIFLLIAGTYTPLTIALLSRSDATILLSVVWEARSSASSSTSSGHRTALAQHPRVRRPRLGRRLVPASAVGRRRPRHRCGSLSRAVSSTRWELSSTARRNPTPPPPGSASTRSSTPSPSPRGPATASPSTWQS